MPSPQLIVKVIRRRCSSPLGSAVAGAGSVNWPMSAIVSSEPSLTTWLAGDGQRRADVDQERAAGDAAVVVAERDGDGVDAAVRHRRAGRRTTRASGRRREPGALIVPGPESIGVPSPQLIANVNRSVVSPPTFSGLSKPGSVNLPMLVIDSGAPSADRLVAGDGQRRRDVVDGHWNVVTGRRRRRRR